MQRSHHCDYIARNAQDSSRQKKESEQLEKYRNTLAQGTGLIELFAAVVDDMRIPEQVGLVLNPMDPVTRKI